MSAVQGTSYEDISKAAEDLMDDDGMNEEAKIAVTQILLGGSITCDTEYANDIRVIRTYTKDRDTARLIMSSLQETWEGWGDADEFDIVPDFMKRWDYTYGR